MRNSYFDFPRIPAYLLNILTDQDKEEFETILSLYPPLAKKIYHCKRMLLTKRNDSKIPRASKQLEEKISRIASATTFPGNL